LEHTEGAFYSAGLANYSRTDFANAGYPPWVRERFVQLASHEKTHVEFLTTAITAAGGTPTKSCQYKLYEHLPHTRRIS
jgi:Ferritin-like domain